MTNEKNGYYFGMFCPDSNFMVDHSGSLIFVGCFIYS